MWEMFKSIMLAAFVTVAMALFFALPLWALWPYGAAMLGAPRLGYLTIASTLTTLGVVLMAGYLGGKTIWALCQTILGSLPEPPTRYRR